MTKVLNTDPYQMEHNLTKIRLNITPLLKRGVISNRQYTIMLTAFFRNLGFSELKEFDCNMGASGRVEMFIL